MNEANLSVIDNRVKILEKVVDQLVELQEQQSALNGRLEQSIALQKQAVDFAERRFNQELANYEKTIKPKVEEMWDNRSQAKGGWWMIAAVGGFVVGAGGVALVILEIVKSVKHGI